jgi:membrane-associated protease RseP (regulator of RpoE activity)
MWVRRKRLTIVALLAVTLLVAADGASGSWPFASTPPGPVRCAEPGPGSDVTGVIYSWRGLLMQRAPATGGHHINGLLVERIEPNSPAAKVELEPGDIIAALDGLPVNTARSLAMAIADHCCGPTVALKVLRDHQFRRIELPPESPAPTAIAAGTADRGGPGWLISDAGGSGRCKTRLVLQCGLLAKRRLRRSQASLKDISLTTMITNAGTQNTWPK